MRERLLVLLVGVVTCLGLIGAAQAQAKRDIIPIAGDLYRFQNNFHFSVFLVTDDGILVTDPIDEEAATWLKAELASRHPGKPIKYLVYSHDHGDHVAGGQVFADTATVVSHVNAKEAIIGEKRPTAVPDVTFSDQMTIEMGGKQVNLLYLGPSHSNNLIVMHFPAERAVFAVDFVSVKRMPYKTLSDAYFPGLINALKALEGMDFDILVPGHGKVGTRADVAEHRQYVEDLYAAVRAGARAGKSLDDMKAEIALDKYSHFNQFEDWRPLNIEGVFNNVSLHRRGN
jgi:glyoxylase-like metal-dependent hydrolase (beta-lactamase superfamily II)